MRMLQQTPDVAPVLVDNGWPTNPQTLKDARTIVFYMDGGGKQSTIAHADEIQKLMDAGVGIVHIHQVIEYPPQAAQQAMQWLGGTFDEKATGSRGHWKESFDHFPEHAITRGVEPFALTDGWIFKLHFVPELKGITPLLRSSHHGSAKSSEKPINDSDNIVCWAYERSDGGAPSSSPADMLTRTGESPVFADWSSMGFSGRQKSMFQRPMHRSNSTLADLMTNLDVRHAQATAKVSLRNQTG